LQAQGRRGFDGIMGSGCRGLMEDDSVADPRMARVVGIVGSRMARGAQRRGLGEDDVVAVLGTVSRAWGQGLGCRRHHRIRSGKMAAHKGIDRA
jgi:hypothetical protein